MEIQKQLDPVMETALLLLLGSDIDTMRDYHIEELNKVDINGTLFYETYLTGYEKYVRSFIRNQVHEADDITLSWKDDEFNQFLGTVIFQVKDFINQMDDVTEKEWHQFIAAAYNEIFGIEYMLTENPTAEEIMALTSSTKLSDSEKWRFATLLQNPRLFCKRFCSMIVNNIPAYEKACEECKSYIKQGLEYFDKYVTGTEVGEDFKKLIPTAALPISILMTEDNCYYGLYWKALSQISNPDRMDSEELIAVLKAISDKSRLEILLSLRESPMYGQEIAEKLGITPATVSHHMNTLMVRNLVTIKKQDGRGYFHLNQEGVKTVIECLENQLL